MWNCASFFQLWSALCWRMTFINGLEYSVPKFQPPNALTCHIIIIMFVFSSAHIHESPSFSAAFLTLSVWLSIEALSSFTVCVFVSNSTLCFVERVIHILTILILSYLADAHCLLFSKSCIICFPLNKYRNYFSDSSLFLAFHRSKVYPKIDKGVRG